MIPEDNTMGEKWRVTLRPKIIQLANLPNVQKVQKVQSTIIENQERIVS